MFGLKKRRNKKQIGNGIFDMGFLIYCLQKLKKYFQI